MVTRRSICRASSPRDDTRSPERVAPNTFVRVRYAAYDADGECVGESDPDRALSFLVGRGDLLPALEQAILGLEPGSRITATLDPEAAFGTWSPERVVVVDRNELPADIELGDRIEAESPDGASVWLKVLEFREEEVVLDTNHPLAGQTIRFELLVETVRRATRSDLRRAKNRVFREAGVTAEHLIPPGRLLRHRSRR
jgi:FKBP-type peptidyl-prolyl cis-trans isomerase SlyD